jgi:hypothetical protein
MLHSPVVRRLLRAVHAFVLVAAVSAPFPASAASTDTVLELRPHCDKSDTEVQNVFGGPFGGDIPGIMTETDGSHCTSYLVADPLHRETELKKIGDELDMDLVIVNPQLKSISRVRGWIAYDPTILQGISVELQPTFGVPTPGESDFDVENGLIKIGASSQTPSSAAVIKVARIKMKVISTPSKSTVLSFDDVTGSVDSHSAAIVTTGGQEANVLPSALGSLVVRLDAPVAHPAASGAGLSTGSAASTGGASSASQQSQIGNTVIPTASSEGGASSQASVDMPASRGSATSVAMSSAASFPTSNTAFTLLQVQNLRATTEGTAVFLAWDALQSPELTGYNVYYGTTSGKYIQRRSIDNSTTTLTVRGLLEGTTYYFAVRGVNAKNQETQFSREVGIKVGSPETSTSPLSASAITEKGPKGKTPKTGGTISGESGPSSVLLVFFVICAGVGTLFAFRRQFISAPLHV